MKKEEKKDILNEMSVPKAVLRNVVPAIGAMMMMLIYNLADAFFIGQTNNDILVAAITIATPVFLIYMALGLIFGMGGTSVISRALGKGDMDFAKKVSSFCMWGSVIVGFVFSLILWLFMDSILQIIGVSPDTTGPVRSYLNIVTIAGPAVMIANAFSNIIRAEGQSVKAMIGMLIGNLINIILDPILILWFGWEIEGAAIATVIGNVVGASYYIFYFYKGKSILSIKLKDFSIKNGVLRHVFAIGVPASLGIVLMSISQIVVNGLISSYGDMAVAAIGVSMRVMMIVIMVGIGIGQGVQPLLGYCVGSNNWQRYRDVFRFSIILAFGLSLLSTLFSYIFTDKIISAFLTDLNALEYSVEFVSIFMSTASLFGVFYVVLNALQAMGEATPSLVINISRQGIIYIPSLFILNSMFGMYGLVWAQPVADVLSLLLAGGLYVVAYRRAYYGFTKQNQRLNISESIG
jgi:Na+-driven multidrug efflux pump